MIQQTPTKNLTSSRLFAAKRLRNRTLRLLYSSVPRHDTRQVIHFLQLLADPVAGEESRRKILCNYTEARQPEAHKTIRLIATELIQTIRNGGAA